MKKYLLLSIPVLALVSFLLIDKSPKEDIAPKAFGGAKKIRSIKTSLNEKLTHRALTTATSNPLDVCSPLFEKLTQISYEEMQTTLPSLKGEINSECQTAMSNNLGTVLKQLLTTCLTVKDDTSKSCEQFFSLLRAKAISEAIDRKLPLNKWTESELMNTILWQFIKEPHPSETSLADNLSLINELLSRVPDSYAAEKAKFVHLLLQELLHKDQSGSTELEESWQKLMEYGAESSLKYFPILKPLMRGDQTAFKEEVQLWQQQNPADPMGYYYGAYSAWKAQDRSSTIKQLERALSLDPKNPQIQKSLQSARSGKFQDPIFTLNFGFSFDEI